eukprot:COSAG02_NODE_12260_length_1572_cov_1.251188_2_plen_65_part_00
MGRSPASLPDLMELIGTCISADVHAICGVARKYGYWRDGGSPTSGRENPGRKKRKRLPEDETIE